MGGPTGIGQGADEGGPCLCSGARDAVPPKALPCAVCTLRARVHPRAPMHTKIQGGTLVLRVPQKGSQNYFLTHNFRILYSSTGQPIPHEPKFWSAPPLFLEDEDIFQKSARVVQILAQFLIVTRDPIFDSHL